MTDNNSPGVAPGTMRSGALRRFYILVLLFIFCTLFYYFGELVDFAGWKALRWEFFYGVHDIHRLLFLGPIIYAGYFFGIRAATITTLVAINVFLPRALFLSPFPDPLARTVLFIVIAGGIGYLTGRESERRKRLESRLGEQRQQFIEILKRIEDGALIIGPDRRIRFVNTSLVRDFGEGLGSDCHEYLYSFDVVRDQICKVPGVMKGPVEKWECTLHDGRVFEVTATAFLDSDMASCRLVIFRNIKRHK